MEKIRKMIGCLALSRVIYGGRASLLLAVAAFFLPGAVGMALSVLAIAAAGGVVVLCAVGFARLLTRGAGAV